VKPKALLQAVGVRKSFPSGRGEVHALRQVDVSVPRGSFTVFMGRSGSGKTTLLNVFGGLDTPTGGEVLFDGLPLSRMSDGERTALRLRRMGFVFQTFALLPTYSAAENVELPLRIARAPVAERSAEIRRCLDAVGLSAFADHRPDELSGGQQQRVAIARALAMHPDLIIADEPTAELDSRTGRGIMELFRRIVDDEGVTLILATHDPTAREYASAVHEIRDGRLAGAAARARGTAGDGADIDSGESRDVE
jgi:ABC-type lipoprotein export system ATPase subunit